ncbi:MAG: hypothetical protein R3277_00760 [Brumimicrobium sp.]|nr:hypothetical protein [Brumimicrobium sp.]
MNSGNLRISAFFLAFIIPLIAGIFFNVIPYIGAGLELLPGDLGDTRFNIFILEHGKQFMTGEVQEYWNASFMYPEAEVISLSDNLIGTAPIYAFYRIIGLDLFTAFQWWTITLVILNYACSFKLFDFIFKNPWIAGIAAFIFTFSLSLASQMNHAQTFPRFALPLALWALLMWDKNLKPKYFVLASTLLVYQFYCGIYLGFLFFIPFFTVFLIVGIKNKKTIFQQLSSIRTLLFYTISIIINLILVYWLFAPYYRRSKDSALHTYQEISHSLPGLLSYLTPPPESLIHGYLEGNMLGHPAFWDHWIFSGWIAFGSFILVSLLLVFRFKKLKKILGRPLIILLFAGLMTFLFTLRIDEYSLYYFIQKIPGYGAMRSMTRVINVQILFFALSAGTLFLLIIRKTKIRSWSVFLVALPLLIVDNFLLFDAANTTAKKTMQNRHENIVSKLEHVPEGSIISYEPDTSELQSTIIHYQIDAMLGAQALHLKSVNGYSARAAYNFDRYWMVPNKENRSFWFARFPEIDTSSIVVVK